MGWVRRPGPDPTKHTTPQVVCAGGSGVEGMGSSVAGAGDIAG